ncbi:BQ2448_4595 [Microbotryum intermedium]|uniref:BQ2448_4595 protein n=1 Tax=Microbotryum intermedium TaxID=269621 RepID=A0A238FID0_9BASI|nr:BQ2448_4595 [Microbotryum intermedium]
MVTAAKASVAHGPSSASVSGPSTTSSTAREPKMTYCAYCPMSFKKLEHAQRHERTHTLDRPYACSTCGKTFARQDTLNRHARLHDRKAEDGSAVKAVRKKRASTLSPPTVSNKNLEKTPSLKGGVNNKTQPPAAAKKAAPLPPPPPNHPGVAAFNFPLVPKVVVPPSFPAYSKPVELLSGLADPAHESTVFPQRRYSDNVMTLASMPANVRRPRAHTLAGLPEALGSFSLVGSPESNGIASSSGESESDDMESDDDEDDDGGDDESSQTNSTTHRHDRKLLSFENRVASEYPSPVFTSCSPVDLHRDTLSDLEAILANDPLHSSLAHTTHFRLGAANPEDGFDFESFAASVENSGHGILDDLLGGESGVKSPEERYPTPPSADLQPHLQPHVPPVEFDFAASFQAADRERREQATREEAARFLHQAAQQVPTARVVPLPLGELNSVANPFVPCAPFNIPLLNLNSPSVAPINLSLPTMSLAPSLPSVSIRSASPSTSTPTSQATLNSAYALAYASSFPSMMTMPNGLGLTTGPESAGWDPTTQLLLNAYKRSQTSSSPAFYMPAESPFAAQAGTASSHPSSRLGLPVPAWSSIARGEGAERAEPASLFVL